LIATKKSKIFVVYLCFGGHEGYKSPAKRIIKGIERPQKWSAIEIFLWGDINYSQGDCQRARFKPDLWPDAQFLPLCADISALRRHQDWLVKDEMIENIKQINCVRETCKELCRSESAQ